MDNITVGFKDKIKGIFQVNEFSKNKNKILSLSLFWLGIGVSIILLTSFLAFQFDGFKAFVVNSILGSTFSILIMSFINIGLIMGIYFVIRNSNTSVLVAAILYIAFVTYQSFYITTMFLLYGYNTMGELLPVFFIPSLCFAIMGMVGYFNLVDFTKMWSFFLFGSLTLIILSFVSIFVYNDVLESIYTILGFSLFTLWIGFDVQMILKRAEFFDFESKSDMWKFSIFGGLSLFIDFINLLMFALRMLRN